MAASSRAAATARPSGSGGGSSSGAGGGEEGEGDGQGDSWAPKQRLKGQTQKEQKVKAVLFYYKIVYKILGLPIFCIWCERRADVQGSFEAGKN